MPDVFIAPPKKTASAAKTGSLQKESTLFDSDSTPSVDQTGNRFPLLSFPKLKIKNKVHLLSSFCKDPEGISFQNQEQNESVLLFVRRDFITNLPWIATGSILILAPLFVGPLGIMFHFFNSFFLTVRFFLFLAFFYYLLVATYIFVNFITWYFNISLVTDIRIMDVTFSNLVYKNVSVTKMDLVQDVSYSQIGIFRNLFDYGDVLIQTAGTLENFVFTAVPEPENVVHIVEDLIGKEKNA